MNLRFYALSIFIMIMFGSVAYSQTTGEITGQIIDKETGEPLRRATVMVVGTKLGGFSDVKGDFKIKNVPAGTHNLKISFVGYEVRELGPIEVQTGSANNVGRVILGLEKKLTEEIFVDARRVNDNESAILATRKNAAQVSDGISQQEMSRLPDSDAGQSLKRVSGVTLVDNKFVYVRGVSERYSNTTLNGASLSSTEPDKKAFAFDMFPSEFLQNVNIAKSFTPDLPGNFAGGLVQLNTVDFPENRAFKVSYSNSFNSNTTLKGNKFIQTTGGSTDWLGMDDGTRALPASVPSTRREFDALRSAATSGADPVAKEKYQKAIQSFNDDTWKQNSTTVNPLANSSIGINYSNITNIGGNDFGLLASLNYGNTYSIKNVERNRLMSDASTMFSSGGTSSTYSTSLGGLLNMAYKLGESSSISLRNVYNRSADDESVAMNGKDIAYQFVEYKNFSNYYLQRDLFSTQLSGEHSLDLSNILMQWNVGYSYSNRNEPDYRKIRYERNIFDVEFEPNTPFTALVQATPQGDGARLGRFFSDMNDAKYSGKLDFTLPLTTTLKLKFGTLGEFTDRDFVSRSFTVIQTAKLDGAIGDLMNDYDNPQLLLANENFRVDDGLRMSEETKLTDSYTASEELAAGYLMIDFPLELAGQDLRFIGGVRYESSKQILNSYDVAEEYVVTNHVYHDILPSINLLWKLDNSNNIRMSATQTLSRPNLRELAPFAFYDFLNQMVVQGNPDLKRALIQNYDLRYEFFPNSGEVISFSVFYKSFDNAIEETLLLTSSEPAKTFQNAQGTAINYGIEVEFRKSLNFLTSTLSNFALNVNLALINSEITVFQGNAMDKRAMWGQSPYSVNVGLFYMNPETQTSVNLAYNTYGKRIIQVAQVGDYYDFANPHVYELPRDMIDLSISQPIFDNKLDLKLIIRDLLNQSLIWQQGGSVFSSDLRGSSIGLSLGYRLY